MKGGDGVAAGRDVIGIGGGETCGVIWIGGFSEEWRFLRSFLVEGWRGL